MGWVSMERKRQEESSSARWVSKKGTEATMKLNDPPAYQKSEKLGPHSRSDTDHVHTCTFITLQKLRSAFLLEGGRVEASKYLYPRA